MKPRSEWRRSAPLNGQRTGSLFPIPSQKMTSPDSSLILHALKAISMQIMELEKRVEGIELRLHKESPLLSLLAGVEGSESDTTEGYESAPASLRY